MIWFCKEGQERRNGINLGWHRGPIVIFYWLTTTSCRSLRIRLRFQGRPALLVQTISGPVGRDARGREAFLSWRERRWAWL